jgi:hypothetical protein
MTYYVYHTDDSIGHILKEFESEEDAREYVEGLKITKAEIIFKIIKGFEVTEDEYV